MSRAMEMRGDSKCLLMVQSFFWVGDEKFLILDSMDRCKLYKYTKTHVINTSKWQILQHVNYVKKLFKLSFYKVMHIQQ